MTNLTEYYENQLDALNKRLAETTDENEKQWIVEAIAYFTMQLNKMFIGEQKHG